MFTRGFNFVGIALFLCGLMAASCVAAPRAKTPAPQSPVAKAALLPSPFSDETQAAMREFRALLPQPELEQNAVLRGLALKDGVCPKPQFPANALLKWLDEQSRSAQTGEEKRAAIQDFLLVARPLVRLDNRTQRRRGLKAAQKAIELAADDIGLRADIAAAFLAPSLLDSDADGAFSAAALLEDLWPRFGRIITLEIQTDAQINAMRKPAKNAASDTPPLQIAVGNAATMPFLKIMATIPNPRRGWAIYRLARLLRAQGETQKARDWFGRLQFGDGSGIFLRQNQIYDPKAELIGTQSSYNIDPEKDEGDTQAINAFVLPAWKNMQAFLPANIAAAQDQFLAEVEMKATQTPDGKRAPIYRSLAQKLLKCRIKPQEKNIEKRRESANLADQATGDALMALLRADGAQNIYYFKATNDAELLARAEELFILVHFEALSGVNYNGGSRYDAMKSLAGKWVLAENLPRALVALELESAICYPGNHWAQVLDQAAKVLKENGRFEDALLCMEAIPQDSGMGGVLVWNAPEIRRQWSTLVQKADRSAAVYERASPPDQPQAPTP